MIPFSFQSISRRRTLTSDVDQSSAKWAVNSSPHQFRYAQFILYLSGIAGNLLHALFKYRHNVQQCARILLSEAFRIASCYHDTISYRMQLLCIQDLNRDGPAAFAQISSIGNYTRRHTDVSTFIISESWTLPNDNRLWRRANSRIEQSSTHSLDFIPYIWRVQKQGFGTPQIFI